MNKALQIFSFTLFLFLFSCEAEFPISLESTVDQTAKEGADVAFMVSQTHGNIIQGEYIVMFEEDIPYFERLDEATSNSLSRSTRSDISEVRAQRQKAIESYFENTLQDYNLGSQNVMSIYDVGRQKGGLLSMNEEDAKKLMADKRIAIVESNEVIAMNLNAGAKGHLVPADDGPSNQWTTFNISYVGGNVDHSSGNTWAFIIDSGIDLDHNDLNVQQAFSKSFVPHESTADDGFGHGTHVAGIIGAKDNGKGVVGVASGAPLVAYKVLDRYGYGTKDYLIQALTAVNYDCIPGDVVNISLGTDKSNIINSMIRDLKNTKGIYFAIAAGNAGTDASNFSPADLQDSDVYVVGAISIFNILTGFSNYGQSVGYLAPGSGIYSTYKDGQYAWMNGTSMAAPHVAGILLASNGKYRTKKQVQLPSGNYAKIIKHF